MDKISKLFAKTDGLLLRCLGLSGPLDTNESPTQISQGVFESSDYSSCPWDTVLVLDISFSMTYKDCRPSRLAASQKALEQYIKARLAISPADRVAVVSFAISARIEMPLTSISKAQSIIDAVMKLKGDGGTDITPGIGTARRILNDAMTNNGGRRLQRILLHTDGRGGSPFSIANEAKSRGVLIDVVGIGGKPSAVDESLLRRVATTDADGFTHYWFIKDTDSLVKHYQQLATSLVWRSGPR
jgi:Mg-chelatase subunit ChlD